MRFGAGTHFRRPPPSLGTAGILTDHGETTLNSPLPRRFRRPYSIRFSFTVHSALPHVDDSLPCARHPPVNVWATACTLATAMTMKNPPVQARIFTTDKFLFLQPNRACAMHTQSGREASLCQRRGSVGYQKGVLGVWEKTCRDMDSSLWGYA